MDGKKKLDELVADLRSQNRCYQCNCIACGREGMGELHDHICTGEEGCKKTARKLDARRRVLQMKCVEAANALRSISDAYKAMEVALHLADEWLACVEPHLRDSEPFKRDYDVIRAVLEDSRYEG